MDEFVVKQGARVGEKDSAKSRQATGPILVAVDFTEDSEAALVWAAEYADRVGCKLIVLHVVHDPGETPGAYRQKDEDLLRPMEDVADKILTQFLQDNGERLPKSKALAAAEPVVVKGIPATRILEIAKTHGARGIVMGSRGRTGLPHLLLGSKAERVVQLAPVPVTIVKARS